jgi:hypothetical protein
LPEEKYPLLKKQARRLVSMFFRHIYMWTDVF